MKVLQGGTYHLKEKIKYVGGKFKSDKKVWEVSDEGFEELKKDIDEHNKNQPKLSGQLWEECACGEEPIYMQPFGKCERCSGSNGIIVTDKKEA